MIIIGRHGSKPGHQVGVQAMSYGMLHDTDIPLSMHSRNDVSQFVVVHLSPLLRVGAELGTGQECWRCGPVGSW